MAGMLPGVELARRRRLPRAGSWVEPQPTTAYSSARRIALCLARNHKARSSSSSSSGHSNRYDDDDDDDDDDKKLRGAAREAKERLDERLRSQTRTMSDSRRLDNNRDNSRNTRPGQPHDNRPRRELFGQTRSSSTKRFMSWTKLTSWKGSSDQEQCAVCLERLMSGETLMDLPCNHRFHSVCLVPWLEQNLQCPCCRAVVIAS